MPFCPGLVPTTKIWPVGEKGPEGPWQATIVASVDLAPPTFSTGAEKTYCHPFFREATNAFVRNLHEKHDAWKEWVRTAAQTVCQTYTSFQVRRSRLSNVEPVRSQKKRWRDESGLTRTAMSFGYCGMFVPQKCALPIACWMLCQVSSLGSPSQSGNWGSCQTASTLEQGRPRCFRWKPLWPISIRAQTIVSGVRSFISRCC